MFCVQAVALTVILGWSQLEVSSGAVTMEMTETIMRECSHPADPHTMEEMMSLTMACTWNTGHENIITNTSASEMTSMVKSMPSDSMVGMFASDMASSATASTTGDRTAEGQTEPSASVVEQPGNPEPHEHSFHYNQYIPETNPHEGYYSHAQSEWLLNLRYAKFTEPCVRSEYRQLHPWKRFWFNVALIVLHQDHTLEPKDLSKWELLAGLHRNRITEYGSHPGAHRGAAFLPWHRVFLLTVENAIRENFPSVCLPYWDPSLEAALDEEGHMSHFFSDDFMGTARGQVSTGPFKFWSFNSSLPAMDGFYTYPGHQLSRDVLLPFAIDVVGGRLWNLESTKQFLETPDFAHFTWCTDFLMELNHGRHHIAIGGWLSHSELASHDPLFIMWHGFLDRLWEEWRNKNPGLEHFTTYSSSCFIPELEGIFDDYHMRGMIMEPFGLPNEDGVRDISHLYRYSERITCSEANTACSTYQEEYAYCDESTYTCVAKKMRGSPCHASKECYQSNCENDQCT